MGSWHLGLGQTGSSTNEAGFHLSYLIRDECRLAFPLQEQRLFSDTSLYEPHALEVTTHSSSPIQNPEQPVQHLDPSSRLNVMLQLPTGHRKAFADDCSLAACSVPGKGHHVAGQESIPCTLVLLRGRAACLEEQL